MNPGVLSEPCLKLSSCLESASTPAWTHHFLFLDIFLIYLDKNSHVAVPLRGRFKDLRNPHIPLPCTIQYQRIPPLCWKASQNHSPFNHPIKRVHFLFRLHYSFQCIYCSWWKTIPCVFNSEGTVY